MVIAVAEYPEPTIDLGTSVSDKAGTKACAQPASDVETLAGSITPGVTVAGNDDGSGAGTGPSVLHALGRTIADLPRVVLRQETTSGDGLGARGGPASFQHARGKAAISFRVRLPVEGWGQS